MPIFSRHAAGHASASHSPFAAPKALHRGKHGLSTGDAPCPAAHSTGAGGAAEAGQPPADAAAARPVWDPPEYWRRWNRH